MTEHQSTNPDWYTCTWCDEYLPLQSQCGNSLKNEPLTMEQLQSLPKTNDHTSLVFPQFHNPVKNFDPSKYQFDQIYDGSMIRHTGTNNANYSKFGPLGPIDPKFVTTLTSSEPSGCDPKVGTV